MGKDRVSPLATSRALLSSGGEVLPGFSGACNAAPSGNASLGTYDKVTNPLGYKEGSDKQASWEMDSYGVLHVIIVVYLFLGIAVICDEQFTSSLECICDPRTGLGLSPDVAGATFMAAGSSAPELASSFIGTFVSKSDVGLGTIIGSAVFNILIIIGSTAIVVGEPMQLDPKPLVRDNLFYMGSVALLILFVAGDNSISWVEALLLLVYYALYILFMAFNRQIMRKVAKSCSCCDETPAPTRRPSFSTGYWADKTKEGEKASAEQKTEGDPAAKGGSGAESQAGYTATEGGTGTGTGNGTVMSMGTMSPYAIDDIESRAGSGTGTGTGAEAEMAEAPASNGEKEAAPEEKKEDAGGAEEEEEEESLSDKLCDFFSQPYIFAYGWTMPDCKYEEPSDEDAEEEIEKLKGLIESNGPWDDDVASAAAAEEQIKELEEQIDLRKQIVEADEAEDDKKVEELRKVLYAKYEPLEWGQRWYMMTFIVSLIWITILSYFMVVLMEKIGCAWGISSFIMGITFLAMGTSVPDALGSIAVAKEGEGDMAVSNAIGSNVFDICMGLGFPWFLATLIDGESRAIHASTESIVASTLILFAVVIVLFFSLLMAKHPDPPHKRFTLFPWVGYILFASYGAFVVFQIAWTVSGLPE
jgi:K+-dependent Na+/Ca+ exchanger-like protein